MFNSVQSAKSANRRMLEVKKLIALDSIQVEKIRRLSVEYQTVVDSAFYLENDPYAYIAIRDSASKVFDTGLAVLTESQLYEYFKKPKRGAD